MWRSFLVVLALGVLLSWSGAARAAEGPIAVGEVSTASERSEIDISAVRDVATAELERIDSSRLSSKRRVVVSLTLTRALANGPACNVSAMLRDARTGTMIAVIEAGVQAVGPLSPGLWSRLTHAAVRNAMRKIPHALSSL